MREVQFEVAPVSEYPSEPFFVEKLELKSGGLDFLGMRQATLDLRESCLPGFSNSTQFLRPFSLMCWTYWKLHALAQEQGIEPITSEQARAFREKVEILFTWGHQLHNVNGLPGITAKPPNSPNAEDERVPLTFGKWKRIPSSTGLMAAVNYGPALKTTSGFGFLNPIASELFQPVGIGVELAKALDESLSADSIPASLTALNLDLGTKQDALALFKAWNISTPSKREQSAFGRVLYEPMEAGDDSSHPQLALRSSTFDLMLAVLRSANEVLTVKDVRRLMFLGRCALPKLNISAAAQAARLRWIRLQVRQAQRLSMEALLSWVEKRILRDGDSSTLQLAEAADTLCKDHEKFADRDWRKYAENHAERRLEGLEDAVRFAADDQELSILAGMDAVSELIRKQSDQIFPVALGLLGLCREYAELMEEIPELRSGLRLGGSEGLSLSFWNDICWRTANLNPKEFYLMVLEELVLSRHFAVATRRYDGRVIRLRITVGENGLVALVPRPWRPAPALDKLESGLSLLADCGFIVRTVSGYSIAK
ncbi:MAG TPA: hypothetical protein VK638_27625 [Edaphobacter sp.]|nr:hypothetical protein [Edaphobacter sp.]